MRYITIGEEPIEEIKINSIEDEIVRNNISLYSYYILNHHERQKTAEHFNTIEELENYLNHTSAWYYMVKNNIEYAIVKEKNVVINGDEYDKRSEKIFNQLINGVDLCILDSHPSSNIFKCNVYFLSLNGAKKLLSSAFPVEMNVDAYISNMRYNLVSYLCKYKLFKTIDEQPDQYLSNYFLFVIIVILLLIICISYLKKE